MATNKFDIILNLQPSRSPFLKLNMSIFDKFDKMYYRADEHSEESFPFDKNLKNWKIEVLYVDASCIQGKISLKTIGNQIIIPISRSEHKGEPTDTLECEFIIDKFPRKGRSPFFHFWNCGNNMSVKHKALVDKQLPKIKEQIILKLKQRELLDRKNAEHKK